MTPSPDDQLDEATAAAQAKKARPARKSAPDAAGRTAAVKARTAKSEATTKAAPVKPSTSASAAKTAAAKAAAAKANAAKAAAKTTAARSAAAKTAAAKTAAAKAAAAKAAAQEAADSGQTATADSDIEPAAATTAARPRTKAPAAKRASTPRKPRAAAARAVAAESAAPVIETVAPPAASTTATEQQDDSVVTADPVGQPVVESDAAPVAEPRTGEAEPSVVGSDDASQRIVDEAQPETATTEEPVSITPALLESVVAAEPFATVEEADVEEVVEGEPAETDAEAEPVLAAEAADETFADLEEPTNEEALRVRGLIKDFGDQRAVNGIDLTVPAGSFYGIVGPNGAGKTTTLSIITGLLRGDGGTVHVAGIDQKADPLAAKRVMGVLPDRLRTFDRLTGRQLLHYYGLLRGLDAHVIEKRSADLARAFDLTGALNRVVSDYSAGMTKKIMLAGAMIHSPRVLVLDEPFESVDPVSSGVILDILRAYVAHGGTVVLSSHGMDLVERVCSRVAIIVAGEVLAEGTVDEVRAGQTLESRFVELAGSNSEVEGLEWLHTFSD
ncbi:ATP-binding cassette domain-containing protein [Microbacterium sp. M28]|uniref:ABC transporter ATP-binding protein n=1 Tax=Microbacterium sp. M28 TaxID=2962064 RepID=UPI0021F3D7DD|nr:ATP-binding cassette domain-containing protein [Microbacterium sp. M28]UYO96077.1 ATP-binding cassette domain-containing protein [Microbacterium sp. M28]